jgi:perosamine synthetase
MSMAELAIKGGPKIRKNNWPNPGLIGPEEKAAIDALFDEAIANGTAIGYNGAQEEAYCKKFAELLGGGHAKGVNSGTAGVFVALRALELEPFTEVITSPITDPGGIMPVVMNNCIPVVADTEPNSYNIGPEQVEAVISPLTSAVLVSHIGGEVMDINGVMAIAKKHNIPVIEDSSQAHGAKFNGEPIGSFGDISVFSTMFGKHHCTGGQGGVVFTKDDQLFWKIRRYSDRGKPFGLPQGSTNCVASLNFSMDEIGAAIGRSQLKKIPGIVQRRREVVHAIKEKTADLSAVSIPDELPGAESSYWFLRMQFHSEKVTCDKETFCQAMIAEGIPIDPSYNHMPHKFEWSTNRQAFGSAGFPWTSSEYKGNPDRQFPCPNGQAAIAAHFNLAVHQGWGEQEILDTVAAFEKVEAAYSA